MRVSASARPLRLAGSWRVRIELTLVTVLPQRTLQITINGVTIADALATWYGRPCFNSSVCHVLLT